MSFKEKLKKDFWNPNTKLLLRYKSSKIILVISSLLFFISFHFVWALFYSDIFISLLSIFYVIFLTSLMLFLYLFVKQVFWSKLNFIYTTIFLIFLLLIYAFSLFPVLYKWGFYWFYTNFLNL